MMKPAPVKTVYRPIPVYTFTICTGQSLQNQWTDIIKFDILLYLIL